MKVSRSGYYAWLKRSESQHEKDDRKLLIQIKRAFHKSRRTYGSPRVHRALRRVGVYVSRKRVERLMRENGLQARVMKLYRKGVGIKRFFTSIENHRLGHAMPTGINQVWVADITYIKVDKRWRFLATVMDLYSRKIISWSLGKNRNTKLTIGVLLRAIKKRQPKAGLIFHTDRGAEYRSYEVQNVLKSHGMIVSMNRPYHSVDNAEMESFYKTLKGDVIRGNMYTTESALRTDLRSYINHFYNKQRLHSSLGYRTPNEYEAIAA